ncbi:MAG: hypothetical protein ABR980_12495, partial [Ignavibacteriaceae bacterium]
MNRIGVNLKNKSLFVSRIVNYCKTSNKDFSMKINNKKRTETIIKKKIKVYGKFDVVVLGGGPAG